MVCEGLRVKGIVAALAASCALFYPSHGSASSSFSSDSSFILNSEQNSSIQDSSFPEPQELRANIDFWVDVYTKYKGGEAVIHDCRDLSIRYEVVDLDRAVGSRASWKNRNRYVESRKRYYSHILRKLADNGGKCSTDEECRVAGFFGRGATARDFLAAAGEVRAQYGLSERFRNGLETSGMFMGEMKRIFASHGLPLDLLALPHVESSFNLNAYSKSGAAGIWQFMRSTGRLYLKIDYSVDERRDPILATEAAAKLLKRNYEELGSWPLAITAYNHGLGGMQRALASHGDDIGKIVWDYNGRAFGFASRNFYSEFLAARKIMKDPEYYFGPVSFREPMRYDEIKVSDYVPAGLLFSHFKYDRKEVESLNPALRNSVWAGSRHIPKGYRLKVPEGTGERFKELYKGVPSSMVFAEQSVPDHYSVVRGDSLSEIARRFRTTVALLVDYNGLDSRHRIYAGQKLKIPSSGASSPRQAKVAREAESVASPRIIPAVASSEVAKVVPASFEKTSRRASVKRAAAAKLVELDKEVNIMDLLSINQPVLDGFQFLKVTETYGVVEVRPEETIGHYSQWAGVSVREILRLNGKRSRVIHLGQKLRVPLRRVSAEQFEASRYEWHLGIFEDFFSSYKVEKVETKVVRRGESLWSLCNEKYDIPLWLVSLYNRDKKLDTIHPGEEIRIPVVEKKDS